MTVTQTPASRTARLAGAWRSGPLSVPGFRLLTFGQFASTIGDYCYAVALPWLVLSGGGSAASLGIVLACYGIPRALLTVPGGALTDRFGLMTLAAVGSFPVATFVAGLLVRHLGPTPNFPVSGQLLALSMAYGLTQREFRDFGTGDKEMLSADKRLSPADA